MAGRLEGKVAASTGGAGGIGAATVRRFVEEGARVLVADPEGAKGEASVGPLAGRALHQHRNVSEERDVEAALEPALSEFRRLDRCSVALELGESGVRVNYTRPGGIATPLLAGPFAGTGKALQTIRPLLAPMHPIRRAGLPGDRANAALRLASDAAGFVNGHALLVDGGLTAGAQWSQQVPPVRSHQPMQG